PPPRGEPVDERVQERPHAAVLAGRSGQEAVHVVPQRDRKVDRRRGGGPAVARVEGQVEEDRDRGQAQVAHQVREGQRAEWLAAARLTWRWPRPVEAEEAFSSWHRAARGPPPRPQPGRGAPPPYGAPAPRPRPGPRPACRARPAAGSPGARRR